MGEVIDAYNRVIIPMTGGSNLQTLKIDSGFNVEPKESANSENVYRGYLVFRFWVDN